MTPTRQAAGEAPEAILAARGLVKRYRKRAVVNGVALSVSAGHIVGLLGPNGAGKTTSFYMMVGLVPADDGRITLGERDITTLPMHQRARLGIGYLPQEASVFRKLSVADNVMAILETRRDLDRQARASELERLLEEMHVGHVRDALGMSLSGGERRRVEIARALAANPRFMLLDEPFAGVDPIAVMDIQSVVKELAERDIGVLITDHNVRETLGICQRAYILNEGQVIAEGTPQQLLDNPLVRKVYLGDQFRM
ncbi:MAG: LPS export ABC transporter ATP-binding protein [Nevskiaceae bacterium]|nr:MAG: LPS export ABC transporter ATP-binding protein [Nevskiaceae bacterium]TBR73342.1 MAG: LPS export ABC transporter ATP-binding protein [Nevskiaceae bacterium]